MSSKPARRDTKEPVRGRKVAVVLLLLIFGVLGFVVWVAMTNRGGTGSGGAPPPTATPRGLASQPEPRESRADDALGDGGRISKTVSDRRVRDELRRRILAGWAQGEGEAAEAARAGRVPSSSDSPDGGLSRDYIRKVVREDFFPMAKGCYEELLSRRDAAGGRLDVKFKIVGDERSGGIVDEVEVVNDGGLADERLSTCIRESMLSVAFEPPPKGGWVTVTYPIEMWPGEPPDK
jgi:hypothetical protein